MVKPFPFPFPWSDYSLLIDGKDIHIVTTKYSSDKQSDNNGAMEMAQPKYANVDFADH